MRLAIVHDALVNMGGAERVVQYMHKAFPDAPIYTSAYFPGQTYSAFRGLDIRPMRWLREAKTEMQVKALMPLVVLGFSRIDFSNYDIVLTSSTYAAKWISVRSPTRHIYYCYTPFRLAWDPGSYREQQSLPRLIRALLPALGVPLRYWDFKASQRADHILTMSEAMARRIEVSYKRFASVINPPIPVESYPLSRTTGEYYLVVSRLNRYKRIDLAILAFNTLKRPLIIVGDGPERRRLEQIASENIRFTGRVTEERLINFYCNCRALIFPGEEDYGLVPLEAQACGKPVIAYRAGGVLETVMEGVSGVFFDEQTPEALIEAVCQLEKLTFNPSVIRKHMLKFDVAVFVAKLRDFVKKVYSLPTTKV